MSLSQGCRPALHNETTGTDWSTAGVLVQNKKKLLPGFPPSARRQRAAGSLWSDTGRWRCGPAPQSGPWGALQTGEQLDGEGRTPAVSAVVAQKEGEIEKHDEVEGISGRDRYTPPRSRPGWECLWRASMQQYIQTYIYLFSDSILSSQQSSSATEEEHRRATSPR